VTAADDTPGAAALALHAFEIAFWDALADGLG